MCYHILTQTGSVISRSTVEQVTSLESEKKNIKELFIHFDAEIHRCLKAEDRGYEGSKPNPQDWAEILEEDADLQKSQHLRGGFIMLSKRGISLMPK